MNRNVSLAIWFIFLFVFGCGIEKAEVIPSNVQEMCDCPVWTIGDSWRYVSSEGEWELKVVGMDEFGGRKLYVLENVYGKTRHAFDARTLQWKLNIGPDGKKLMDSRPNDWYPYYSFPLYVGKKWGRVVTGEDWFGAPRDYRLRYRVLSFEAVTVRAGIFMAFKIECVQESSQTSGNRLTYYIWYSPEVKNEVKSQFGSVEGVWSMGGMDYELKRVKLADN